jgi:Immunoglobulin domain
VKSHISNSVTFFAFLGIVFLAGACSSAPTGTLNSTPSSPSITAQPTSQTVTVGQAATFTVTATGTAPLDYQWQKNGANISGATSASYTTPPTTSADNGTAFQVVVSNSAGSVTSNAATLTVTPVSGAVNVLTYHNDNARTGLNPNETILTPANVNSTNFGKKGFLTVQGLVDAEPLYVSNLMIGGAAHNVVYVATEHDLVYAFDADTLAQLWQVSVLGANETPSDDRGCSQVTPEIGVTSTPIIDPNAGPHGAIFLVAMSKDLSGNYYQRLHALDLTTGAELSGSPTTIQATYPNSSGQITFDPGQYKERASLLLLNGVIYLSWASHCDYAPYNGWVMGYSESTLQQVSVLNFTPNGSEGSVWMSGAGLAADNSANIYFLAANGTFDTTLDANGFPVNGDYGNAFLKLSTGNNSLSVADYFNMHNTVNESNQDQDLGSGGALVLPDQSDSQGKTWHLAVGAGKDAIIYIVNRDNMGKFNPSNDGAIYQEISSNGLSGSVYSMPAYFNNTVYFGAVGDSLKALPISNAKLVTPPASQSAATFAYPGATPSISANGTSNGIVWALENSGGTGILHAYDAANLGTELYNSNQAGSRDQFSDNKFITPMIANGKVYVGTPTGIIVFGLLH